MILFAVYPGAITSKNDWARHHVTASDLMELHRINVDECVVFLDEHDTVGWNDRRADLMPIIPRVEQYSPVTSACRERLLAGERWWSAADHPWPYRLLRAQS